MKEKRANSRPVLARDWTCGQHKRVIISFFTLLVILNDYDEQDRGRTTEQLCGMIQFPTWIDYRTIRFLELYPSTLMRLRLHVA